MRVFLCEFLTSGGLRDAPLPADAVAEALLLRSALAQDLEAVPGITALLAHDDRLPAPEELSTPVAEGADPMAVWQGVARGAQVVWPVALDPARLPDLMAGFRAEPQDAANTPRIIGGTAEALAILTDRCRLSRVLAAAGMMLADEGAGAPASLSVLARPDGLTLLTLNLHHLAPDGRLASITVGAQPDGDGRLAAFANAVVRAVPGLSGIFDIEVALRADGMSVTGITPGPALSYAGLHRSRGVNPLAFLPQFIREGRLPAVPHLPPPVAIELRLRD
ncbi:hypothetical protein ACLBXM_24015 [Xanthobacteraceae bacterium A53D]